MDYRRTKSDRIHSPGVYLHSTFTGDKKMTTYKYRICDKEHNPIHIQITGDRAPAAKVYISGSITKDSDYRAHFRTAEEKLWEMGMKVFNPAKFEADPNKTWEDYMRKDITELMTCRAIYLLKGWRKSKGARLEYRIAKALGMIIMREQ